MLGGGVAQDKAPGGPGARRGGRDLERPRALQAGDKLMLVRGAAGGEAPPVRARRLGARGYVQGATALKGDRSPSPRR